MYSEENYLLCIVYVLVMKVHRVYVYVSNESDHRATEII